MSFLDKNLSSERTGIPHWSLEALEAIAMLWGPCHTWEIIWLQSPLSCWILVKIFSEKSHPGCTWGQGAYRMSLIGENTQNKVFGFFFSKGCIRLKEKSWHFLFQWLETPLLKSKKAQREVRGESLSTGRKGSQRHSGTGPSHWVSVNICDFPSSFRYRPGRWGMHFIQC